eukprot:5510366-Alexandrium_andersonii.AAC.1
MCIRDSILRSLGARGAARAACLSQGYAHSLPAASATSAASPRAIPRAVWRATDSTCGARAAARASGQRTRL